MYKSYLKIAWRSQVNNKAYSIINIGGMAVGMVVAILIGLWVWDELSFNQNHRNWERIAQVFQNEIHYADGEVWTWSNQAWQLGPELRKNYDNNFKYIVMSSRTRTPVLSIEGKALSRSGRFMEPDVLHLLSINMLKGSDSALNDPYTILLSESVAKAFFGDSDPIGEIIKIDHRLDVEVTGVYEDLPVNSTFKDLSFIAPWELMVITEQLVEKLGWGNSSFHAFVQLAENVDIHKASIAIKDVKLNNVEERDKRYAPELFLHPMEKWHLYSEFNGGVNVGGRIRYVWLFATIGIFVLLLACINFMNLSTALYEKRGKEVGIRKVLGSTRAQLISQFFSETLLMASLAFAFSILLVQLTLPWFNEVADTQLTILWSEPLFWLSSICFIMMTGMVAGSYPALYLSSFKPARVLKGSFRLGRLASLPRKVLVIVQFTVSVTLIIGAIIVYQQIQLVKNRPLGYELEGLITIPMKTGEVHSHFDAFRNDLLATGAISEISLSASSITNTWTSQAISGSGFNWKGKDPSMPGEIITGKVNHEFGKTVGWKIKEGRDFSRAFASDTSRLILNETAVKFMGLENPIGEPVKAFGKNFTVIGVVEDMLTQSVFEQVRPTFFHIDSFNPVRLINVKLNSQLSVSDALAKIEKNFKKHNPATPFEYNFADDEFAAKYAFEERIGKLTGLFAIIAVFISCLGLLGLISFVAEQRTKEIGIRKVLGASVQDITLLLSRDFLKLVLLAILIASPIAWWVMQQWLQDFAYRISISWWIFAGAGLMALLIALVTVSYQTIKAARANPVKNLRTE